VGGTIWESAAYTPVSRETLPNRPVATAGNDWQTLIAVPGKMHEYVSMGQSSAVVVIRRPVLFRRGPWRPQPLPRPVADMQEQSWRVAPTGLPDLGATVGIRRRPTAVSVDAFPSEDQAPGTSAASTLDSPAGQRVFGAHLESGLIPKAAPNLLTLQELDVSRETPLCDVTYGASAECGSPTLEYWRHDAQRRPRRQRKSNGIS
jgi:hypothetical protein